jgi:hypothetical protein
MLSLRNNRLKFKTSKKTKKKTKKTIILEEYIDYTSIYQRKTKRSHNMWPVGLGNTRVWTDYRRFIAGPTLNNSKKRS